MIVELESVAVGQASGLCKGDATRALTTLSIPVLDRHDLVREVALVHIEVQAVHGNQLHESDVVRLLLLISDVVAKHESASLARVGMEVQEHLEAPVLSLLRNCLARRPDGGIVSLRWVEVHPVEVAGHSIQAVVSSGDSIWV